MALTFSKSRYLNSRTLFCFCVAELVQTVLLWTSAMFHYCPRVGWFQHWDVGRACLRGSYRTCGYTNPTFIIPLGFSRYPWRSAYWMCVNVVTLHFVFKFLYYTDVGLFCATRQLAANRTTPVSSTGVSCKQLSWRFSKLTNTFLIFQS